MLKTKYSAKFKLIFFVVVAPTNQHILELLIDLQNSLKLGRKNLQYL